MDITLKRTGKQKTGKRLRGYFLSLSIVTVLLLLSIFVIQIVTSKYNEYSQLRNQIFAEKVSFTLDDVRMDIKKIVSFSQSGNSSQIVLTENYSYNKSQFLSQEQSYLNYFANITSLNISFSYSLPLTINFTNGMVYLTNESDQLNKEIKIYNQTGTNLSINVYNVTIYSNQTRGSYTAPTFLGSGTYVILNYIDPVPAKSFTSEGYLDPSSINNWTINLPTPTQRLTISFGSIDGKINSLSIKQNSINSISYVKTVINMTEKKQLEGNYNILINITSPLAYYSNYIKII